MIGRRSILCLLVCLPFAARCATGSITAVEKARIEALLADMGKTPDGIFIRNGTEYDPPKAAKFFHGKWERFGSGVRTAEEFIDQLATKSSTSGKDYEVRFKDGTRRPLGPFLHERLKALGAAGPVTPPASP